MPATPISNKQYNLVSVVYHAAQGAETCQKYLDDARQDGDQDVVRLLEEATRQYEDLAKRAHELIQRQRR